MKRNQSGFAGLEVIILVVLAIGIGLFAWQTSSNRRASENATQVTAEVTAPEIQADADLDSALQALDKVVVDDSKDSAELDSELSAF